MTEFNTPLPSFLRDGDAIRDRVAELNRFISESLKDTSVDAAANWAKAQSERERLVLLVGE